MAITLALGGAMAITLALGGAMAITLALGGAMAITLADRGQKHNHPCNSLSSSTSIGRCRR